MSSAPPSVLADAVSAAASSVLAAARAARVTRTHKFGGTSVADATRMLALRPLVDDGADASVVVVSAMSGTTNALIAMADRALAGQDWRADLDALRDRHLLAADAIDPDRKRDLHHAVVADFDALRHDLDALALGTGDGAALLAQVHGLGEIVSSRLVQAALGDGWGRLDARDVLVVHPGEMGVGVDWAASRERLAAWRARNTLT